DVGGFFRFRHVATRLTSTNDLIFRLQSKDTNARCVLVDVVPGRDVEQSAMQAVVRRRCRTARRLCYGPTRRRWRAAPALVLHLGVGVQVGPGVDDLYDGEASLGQLAVVLVDQHGPVDAADISHQVLTDLRREPLLQGDVADCQATTGLQRSADLPGRLAGVDV